MESLPPQSSRRNSYSSPQTPALAETASRDESVALSMVSEDSQTVLLDNPSSLEKDKTNSEQRLPRPAAPSRSSTSNIKKCWICICDSTEDDPIHPPKWRSPCTCNLTAHEACLLDWVATLENTRGRRAGPPKKFQCPQCKTEIKVDRPTSLILSGVKAWGRLVGRLTLPGMAAVLGTTVWAGCFYHGLHSVRMVFGEPQASFILHRASRHWGWLSGYALVPLTLIAARTNYADFVIPGSTVFLLATQLSDPISIDWTMWPPRSSTVFACLPVVRNSYNFLYDKAFGNFNRKWLEEIKPRQMQESNNLEGNEEDNEMMQADEGEGMEVADEDVLLELNLEFGMGDNAGEEDQAEENGNRRDRHPQQNEPQPAVVAAEDAAPPAGQAAAGNGARNHERHDEGQINQDPPPALLNRRPNELISDTTSLFHSTASALLFPSIAAGMGALLQLALPSSWTRASSYSTILANSGREQLLRTRWGRSVVGGCLFVVLKDALVLYARWRMARDHRKRKIMDWDRAKMTWVVGD